MRKMITFLALVLVTITFSNAQQIETKKVFGGYTYSQNGQPISMGQLVSTMESNTQALELIKKARANNTWATIISSAGGALIGYPLGQSIGGGEANWTLAGVGAGLVVIAIPISSSANKKAKQAVDLYNNSQNLTADKYFQPEFNVIATTNQIGLSLNF